jgi:hypothetical protein
LIAEDNHIAIFGEKAKKLAYRIKKGNYDSLEDHILALRYWWSKHYNRPMKDPILETYSVYDLYLEMYLHADISDEEMKKDVLNEHAEELASIFDDLDESDKEFVKAEFPEADEWKMSEEDFA